MSIVETLEETREFAGDSGKFDEFTDDILDLGEKRIGYMDAAGIDIAILSLNAPAVQSILDVLTRRSRFRAKPMTRLPKR